MVPDVKKCSKCKIPKALTEFNKRAAAPDGRQAYCRRCQKETRESARYDARVYAKRYRDKYPERRDAAVQAWRDKNSERYKASRDAWRTEHRESHNAHTRAWRRRNPESARATDARNAHKRRLAKLGNGACEDFDVREIFARDNWLCQLCGESVDPQFKGTDPRAASLDHIMPLSKGGTHERANVQLAHFGCNASKGNKIPEDLAP